MLQLLLQDVYNKNPFYKRKYKNIDITTIKNQNDLTALPFTTKEEMRKSFPRDLSSGYTIDSCIHESTSGSTGSLLDVYHDQNAYDYYESMAFRNYHAYGYRIHYKIAYTRFEPNEKEIVQYFGFFRKKYIPVHYPPHSQVDILVQYHPQVLSAYPSSLYEMARFIEDNGITIPQLKFIISHSELLTEGTREYVQKVFNCPVYQDYSSFEVHFIATECPHQNMHLHIDNTITEIIKDGEPAAPGETGEIVVTNLMNRAMPFIRYKTGDLGAFDEKECPCGRGLPLLKVVEGRKDEHLILPSGKKVSPRISDLLHFKFEPFILKYQIYQKKKDEIVIKVVKKDKYTKKIRKSIKKEVKEYINEPIDVEVVEVDDIEKTGRGKYRAVISELK